MPRMNVKPSKRNFNKKQTLKRLLGYVFKTYPVRFTIICICILIAAVGIFIKETSTNNIQNFFEGSWKW